MTGCCLNCGKPYDDDEEGWTITDDGSLLCPECSPSTEPKPTGLAVHEESDEGSTASGTEPPVETISDDELRNLYGNTNGTTEDVNEEPKKRKLRDIFKHKPIKGRTLKRRKPKDDVEYDVDSWHERKRRWNLIHKEGYVILKTLSREPNGEYLLETTLVKAEDLPRAAVAVTGEKNTYCLDKIKSSAWYVETHIDPHADYYESQFTASDAALYMTSNKIDNALAIKWTELSHVDFKKYIWIIVIGLVVVLFLIMRMRG